MKDIEPRTNENSEHKTKDNEIKEQWKTESQELIKKWKQTDPKDKLTSKIEDKEQMI